MNLNEIESLLNQEMEEIRGGDNPPPACSCTLLAKQGGSGICYCQNAANQTASDDSGDSGDTGDNPGPGI